MADTEIKIAEGPARIAQELIETIDDHKDLADADIRYLFTAQTLKTRDKVILGKASRAGALLKFFASGDHANVAYGPDYILIFSEEQWDAMSNEKRLYTVDHQLSYCYKNIREDRFGNTIETWALRAPDVECFRAVVQRRGLVMPEVRSLAKSLQIPLDLAEKEAATV